MRTKRGRTDSTDTRANEYTHTFYTDGFGVSHDGRHNTVCNKQVFMMNMLPPSSG